MKCQRCESERIMRVSGKTSDLCVVNVPHLDLEHVGYVPSGLPISDDWGDYIEVDICLECGQTQFQFPLTDVKVRKALTLAEG